MGNSGKAFSLWIRGRLIRTDRLWSKWLEAVEYFVPEMPVDITHISACSPTFKSDKYLIYPRVKKRLAVSFGRHEEFDYLGFSSIPEVHTSMSGDAIFSAVLWKSTNQEILISFLEEQFHSANLEMIEALARPFFESGRVELFRNDKGDFPCNYTINFHRSNGYKPRGFESLKVDEIR